MRIIDCIGAGLMMMGLVLGAMTGAIAMLLIPVAAGAAVMGAASCYRYFRSHQQDTISFLNSYPPYRYKRDI